MSDFGDTTTERVLHQQATIPIQTKHGVRMRLASRDTPEVTIIASGDLRLSANQTCWPEQENVESAVAQAIRSSGYDVVRGHPVDANKGHGFIDSQKYGRDVFQGIHPESPIVVVFAAWQYSHHVLAGLMRHIGVQFSRLPIGAVRGRAWWGC